MDAQTIFIKLWTLGWGCYLFWQGVIGYMQRRAEIRAIKEKYSRKRYGK
jgi:hypothetical protein